MDSLQELQTVIDRFSEERDWAPFQTPANLAKSVSIEAGELLECFQWDEKNFDRAAVEEELADVLNYCLRLSSVLGCDVRQIVLDKIAKNAAKYPVEKARGNATKYTHL